ncbi:MAG: T9SS type A sorting domain-containing protein [Candidatus Latescibacteria bacterium]|nr:T9SS type A sorting domain-containing protein [Candidatus Latescibacterota bacterium]
MNLYESGTGSERTGVDDIHASLGDTISIDVFIRNLSQVPVSAIETYFTVDDRYFRIASQGINEEKNEFYKHFKPFIQGKYFQSVYSFVATYGNNTFGDSLTAKDNSFDGWQLNYVEITGPDEGFGRPVSKLRYGVVATFKLIAIAPCDSSTIKLDVDQFYMRVSSYHDPGSNDSFYFQSFQTCYISVTGIEISPPLPDIIMAPNSSNSSLDLDEHVGISSIPDSMLIWSATGNNNINVYIDPSTHVVTFTAPQGYKGFEDITFTVTDGSINSSSDIMRVTVDDPPRLLVNSIPDTLYIHEDSLEVVLNLQQIVMDSDDIFGNLNWFFSTGGNVTPFKDGNLLSLLGAQNFYGMDKLKLSVYDSFNLGDSLSVPVMVLPINDPPVLDGLPNVTFERGDTHTFNIMSYVLEVDGDPLTITWTEPEHFIIHLNGTLITIAGEENYIGSEQVTFTVTDPPGLSDTDSMLVTVTPAKKPPVWSRLPKVGFAQNEADSSLVLWDYITDPDDEDSSLTFEITNDDDVDRWDVNYNNGKLYLWDLNDTPGWDRLTITAADPDGNTATTKFLAFIAPADGTPIVGGIPDTTIVAGDVIPNWIDLDDYYYDIDNADSQMKWTWARQADVDSSVTVSISVLSHITGLKTLGADKFGINRIIYTVTDPDDKFADDICIITVMEDLTKPVMDLPAKVGFIAGARDSLDLDDYVDDPMYLKSDLTWLWFDNIKAIITLEEPNKIQSRPISFTGPPDWIGWERVEFIVSNPLGGAAKDTLTVFSVPDDGSPVAGGLLTINMKAGECRSVYLDDYYYDADTPYYNMEWTVSESDSITVNIDPLSHIATVCAPSESWEGRENITFTVTDPQSHSSSMDVLVTVTDAFIRNVFSIMVFRNPMQNDYMDIYIKSREDLSVKPTMDIFIEQDSTRVSLTTMSSGFYNGRYLLPLSRSLGFLGIASIIVKSTTLSGKAVQDSSAFSYGHIGLGGAKMALGPLSLDIPKGALGKPVVITMIPDMEKANDAEVTPAEVILSGVPYKVEPYSLELDKPMSIGFSVFEGTVGAGVYRLNGDLWEFAGASKIQGKITAEIDKGGIYSLGYDQTPPQIKLVGSQDDTITLSIADYGSGIDENSINLVRDGMSLPFRFDSVDSEIIFNIEDAANSITSEIEVIVSDKTGNKKVEPLSTYIKALPSLIYVEQNSPNPFNPMTFITFETSSEQVIHLEVYDLLGRKVKTLAHKHFSGGRHTFAWDARDENGRSVSSGIYLYKVISGTQSITRKMILLR